MRVIAKRNFKTQDILLIARDRVNAKKYAQQSEIGNMSLTRDDSLIFCREIIFKNFLEAFVAVASVYRERDRSLS